MSTQRDEALELANLRRAEQAEIRIALRSGAMTLAAVMADPPVALANVLLIDVIRWARECRARATVTEIGRRAMHDNVNLMMPLGRASQHSREWVADNGGHGRVAPSARLTSEQLADRRRVARELFAVCGSYSEVGRALHIGPHVAHHDCRSIT